MNVQDTIYYHLAAYASLFPNRAASLNQLFCVNGNGYEWVKGQLVNVCAEYPKTAVTLSQKIAYTFDRRRKSNEIREAEEKRWREELDSKPVDPAEDAELDAIIEQAIAANTAAREADPEKYEREVEEREREFAALKQRWEEDAKWEYAVPDNIDERLKNTTFDHWYPICQYAKLVNIPKNIQPDWLDALIETAELMIAQPRRPDQYMNEKMCQHNFDAAVEALVTARKIRDKRLARRK